MHFFALFHDPLTIRKQHCRDATYNELADIDILRTRRKHSLRSIFFFFLIEEKKGL